MRSRFALLLLASAALPVQAQNTPTRLSDWLLQDPAAKKPDAYPLGLSWRVPGEVPPQLSLKFDLLQSLDSGSSDVRADAIAVHRMREWLKGLQATGRVPVALADARWLQGSTSRDPILQPGHSVVMPTRPQSVTVINGQGMRCSVAHDAGTSASAYLAACDANAAARSDWAWVVQPDGHIERYGIANWNRQEQDEPAPGAWIWAPGRDDGWSDAFSYRLVSFLATQGPAPDLDRIVAPPGPSDRPSQFSPNKILRSTYGDWGDTGVLQTPSARMESAGTFGFTLSRTPPYTRINFSLQPFDWLQATFRYVNVSNRAYDSSRTYSATQAYKDKSIDLKFRLTEESAYMPQLAVGIRDLTGTGLFSGEYFVANKRTGPIDWSAGLGWGYVGGRGNIPNPLRLLGRSATRSATVGGQGGNFSLGTYFSGPVGLFGGAQVQTPWESLILKLEYDGNHYQNEPQANNQVQRSPWNIGAVYRLGRGADLSLALERGNTLMLGLTLHTDLTALYMPKVNDAPRVAIAESRPVTQPNWANTLRDLERQTDWHISRLTRQDKDVRVIVSDGEGFYWRQLAERAAAVLHRDAPAEVERFTLVHSEKGIDIAEHVIDRDSWVRQQTRTIPPNEKREPLIARAPRESRATEETLTLHPRERVESGVGFSYQQILGGPDGFILFQASALGRAKWRVREDTWLQGSLQLAIADNFSKYKYTAPSNLPRVRTFMREYATSSRLTIPNLQATHVGQIGDNQYYSVYGGLLETMFAGVGAEWLYRPFGNRFAIGVDANAVQQRDFKQDFSLRDYKVLTGHVSLYWDTGWKDVQATINAGRYLAKDIGVTLNLARTFDNGVKFGVFATKTNVSSAQFGEGSFDKGIYVHVPFDAFLTRSSGTIANFTWRPLTRDGGAMLFRETTLNNLTRLRDRRSTLVAPAPPPNETVIPADRTNTFKPPAEDPAPYTRQTPRPMTEQWQSAPERYEWVLMEALARQGFRDIEVSLDNAHRLQLSAANDQLQPLSRAAGRAARTALNLAPLDTREISITLTDGRGPGVVYKLLDMKRLDGFLSGDIDREDFAASVTVAYPNPNLKQNDPLEAFADLSQTRPERTVGDVLLPGRGTVYRIGDDLLNAGRYATDVGWLRAAAAGAGMIFLSSRLDRRADQFAATHNQNRGAKGLISAGNALPWLAMGGAALAAIDSSDPERSRTAYSALEAGGTAFLVATGLKYAVGRARPTVTGNNDFAPFSSKPGHDSFPSRHAMVAWAVATPFAEHWRSPWIYGLAGLSNLARVGSREHWLSDTVAGSLLGYGIGKIFYESATAPTKGAPQVLLSPNSVQLKWTLP